MKKNQAIMTGVLCLSLCLAAGAAWAHDLWITCPQAGAGQKLLLDIGLGHDFPQGDKLNPDELEGTYVIGTGGKIKAAPQADKSFQSAQSLAAGSYVAASGTKPVFFTKSPAGYVRKTKDQVPEAIKCFRSIKYAKAIVNLGGQAGEVSQPLGQDLEIVPLANPAGLKAGGELPVKVLLSGKPLAGAEVSAMPAASGKEKVTPFKAKTGSDGIVKVKLESPGLWLVRVSQRTPYKDPAKCDVLSKAATLTFEIK